MADAIISRYLDHAVLKPELSRQEAEEAIKLGIKYKVRTVCVRPCDIELAVQLCRGTETQVSCVLAFPHGDTLSEIKAQEARLYIEKGTDEIDMVVNYGYIRSGLWKLVEEDVLAVSRITKAEGIPLKVILETNKLTAEEISEATEIAITAGADYVKTSTGFNGPGATKEAVEVMVKTADGRIKVKASGGIRNYEQAKAFVDMGCDRLGNGYSSTPAICDGAPEAKGEAY